MFSKKYALISLFCVLIATYSFYATKNNANSLTQSTLKSQQKFNQIINLPDSNQTPINIRFDQNLQFSNYTGTAITADMVTNYIKVISNAYSFYGGNLNLTTDYISKQLEASYGWVYNVAILLLNQRTSTWLIYNVGNSVVVWSNVNSYQTNWTYIIWPLYKSSSQTTDYISGLGRGTGIDTSKETVIRNIVKAQEDKYSQCLCSQTDINQMNNKLRQFDGQSWSIICKRFSSISFNSLLKTINSQYIQLYVTTNKCEYVLAVAN